MDNDATKYIFFFAVLIPSLIFALKLIKILWIEILKVVASKSPRAFQYITCGTKDITAFKALHMPCVGDEKNGDEDYEEKKLSVRAQHLIGFKASDSKEHFSSALAINMNKKCRKRRI